MPRAGLTRDKVVALAADVVDDVGVERLTLAAVAERAGVALPSLYKHVSGIDGLHRDLSVLALRELVGELTRAAAGKAGRDALVALADAMRDYARRHPGRYAASAKAPDPDDDEHAALSNDAVTLVVDVLAAYRIAGTDAIDAVRAVRAAVHGFVALEAAGGFRMAQDLDASYHRLIDALDVAFTTWAKTSKGTKR
jgi:AcrR family transcriptional regulator